MQSRPFRSLVTTNIHTMLSHSSSLQTCNKPFTARRCRNVLPAVRSQPQGSEHKQPARQAGDAGQQVTRRQLLGAAGLLCSAAGLIGQPLPAAAFVQTPDGYRSQVDRCAVCASTDVSVQASSTGIGNAAALGLRLLPATQLLVLKRMPCIC